MAYKGKKEIHNLISKLDIDDAKKWIVLQELNKIHERIRYQYKFFSNLRIENNKVLIDYEHKEYKVFNTITLLEL